MLTHTCSHVGTEPNWMERRGSHHRGSGGSALTRFYHVGGWHRKLENQIRASLTGTQILPPDLYIHLVHIPYALKDKCTPPQWLGFSSCSDDLQGYLCLGSDWNPQSVAPVIDHSTGEWIVFFFFFLLMALIPVPFLTSFHSMISSFLSRPKYQSSHSMQDLEILLEQRLIKKKKKKKKKISDSVLAWLSIKTIRSPSATRGEREVLYELKAGTFQPITTGSPPSSLIPAVGWTGGRLHGGLTSYQRSSVPRHVDRRTPQRQQGCYLFATAWVEVGEDGGSSAPVLEQGSRRALGVRFNAIFCIVISAHRDQRKGLTTTRRSLHSHGLADATLATRGLVWAVRYVNSRIIVSSPCPAPRILLGKIAPQNQCLGCGRPSGRTYTTLYVHEEGWCALVTHVHTRGRPPRLSLESLGRTDFQTSPLSF